MPLIVMLHGCTQSPEDFAVGTGMNALAEEFRCLVAWPAQPQGANVQKCWNWFRPEDQARGRGEPCLLAGIVHDIQRNHPADPGRIYVAGLSAGGAAAAIMGAPIPTCSVRSAFIPACRSAGHRTCLRPSPPCAAALRWQSQITASTSHRVHGLARRDGASPVTARRWSSRPCGQSPGPKVSSKTGTSAGGRTLPARPRHEDIDGRSITEHWEIGGCGPCLVRRAAGRELHPTLRARMLRAR